MSSERSDFVALIQINRVENASSVAFPIGSKIPSDGTFPGGGTRIEVSGGAARPFATLPAGTQRMASRQDRLGSAVGQKHHGTKPIRSQLTKQSVWRLAVFFGGNQNPVFFCKKTFLSQQSD
jgi:hypothetical protein